MLPVHPVRAGTDPKMVSPVLVDSNRLHRSSAMTSSSTPQEQPSAAFRESLLQSCSQLEKARCHAAELEGWTSFLTSQVLEHNQLDPLHSAVISTEALPGSVADGWKAIASAAHAGGDAVAKKSDSRKVRIPAGQHAVAIQKVCVANSCKRMAVAASHVVSRATGENDSLPTIPEASMDSWMHVLYDKLGQVQRYHAEHPTAPVAEERQGNPVADGYDLAAAIPPWAEAADFTPDEIMGKYMDLSAVHTDFLQQQLASRFQTKSPYTYVDFLEDIAKGGLSVWKEESKLAVRRKYSKWLVELEQYLRSFLERTIPLVNVDSITKAAETQFEGVWGETGGSIGWSAKPVEAPLAKQGSSSSAGKPTIDLSKYASAEELLADVDANTLKTELSLLGLKCGGAPKDRAARLFLLKDSTLEELPPKHFVKQGAAAGASGGGEQRVHLARREAVIQSLLDQLRPTLEATIRRLERRQTQTLRERETEMENDIYGPPDAVDSKVKANTMDSDDDDEDDAPIYNPKNIPLDWDGKPIPFWLFKLHGLNHYYPCEICGGEASYRGRRAFELHFAEQRHSAAMRVLGIPNTKHFHGITTVEDAQELWKSLQEQLKQERFDGDNEEEYEDSHGVVLSRKKYEDLARQGLL